MKRNLQKFFNAVFFPLRCLFPNNEYISFLPITPLADERFNVILDYLQKGYLLDIGCGDNRLVEKYRKMGGTGLGLDIAPNHKADIEVGQSETLSFQNNSFDYITLVASFNHIPSREKTIREAYRCLKPGGKIFITNLTPIIGFVGHKIWRLFKSDLDLSHGRKMTKGEKYGLANKYIKNLLFQAGFVNIKHKKFSFGLNNLIIASKANVDSKKL